MTERITETLCPFFERIRTRRGLRRWMSQALTRRPELPALLREITRLLADLELLYGFDGSVRMTRLQLYELMAGTRPEWVCRVPDPFPGPPLPGSDDSGVTGVPMIIADRLGLDQATCLGKMVGLLAEGPKGLWGLDHDLLKKLKRAHANAEGAKVNPSSAG